MTISSAQKAFAANLAYWLKAEGRKQSWLAEKLGVHRVVIYKWKNGDAMPPAASEIYDQLAELMGLPSTACLFMEDGVKDPKSAMERLIAEISKR